MPAFTPELDGSRLGLTECAEEELNGIFAGCSDGDILGIRLLVTGTGCSGMSYAMTFTDRQLEHDRVLHCGRFDIYIDAVAFGYLDGASIDFERRDSGDTFVFHDVFQATDGSGACGGCVGALSG